MTNVDNLKQNIENKYANQKSLLIAGYERAKTEAMVHQKQKNYNRYKKYFHQYAYPIGAMKIRREDAEEANKFMEKEEAKRTEQINQ